MAPKPNRADQTRPCRQRQSVPPELNRAAGTDRARRRFSQRRCQTAASHSCVTKLGQTAACDSSAREFWRAARQHGSVSRIGSITSFDHQCQPALSKSCVRRLCPATGSAKMGQAVVAVGSERQLAGTALAEESFRRRPAASAERFCPRDPTADPSAPSPGGAAWEPRRRSPRRGPAEAAVRSSAGSARDSDCAGSAPSGRCRDPERRPPRH